jgi:hypothetical protein
MKTLWDVVRKYEFWFTFLIIVGLWFGYYQTGERWMGKLADLLVIIAIGRLAMRLMKKNKT